MGDGMGTATPTRKRRFNALDILFEVIFWSFSAGLILAWVGALSETAPVIWTGVSAIGFSVVMIGGTFAVAFVHDIIYKRKKRLAQVRDWYERILAARAAAEAGRLKLNNWLGIRQFVMQTISRQPDDKAHELLSEYDAVLHLLIGLDDDLRAVDDQLDSGFSPTTVSEGKKALLTECQGIERRYEAAARRAENLRELCLQPRFASAA